MDDCSTQYRVVGAKTTSILILLLNAWTSSIEGRREYNSKHIEEVKLLISELLNVLIRTSSNFF